jgi:capsular polysaccharide export protein
LARVGELQQDQAGHPRSAIEALTRHRVGGTYWARQPNLPQRYILVRSGGPVDKSDLPAGDEASPVVLWTDEEVSGVEGQGSIVVSGQCDPWHMVAGASEVIVDAEDELALVAALAKVPVRCLGEGRFAALGSGSAEALDEAVRSSILQTQYRSPFTDDAISPEEAIALCGFWRSRIDSNRPIRAILGCASWKRPTVGPLLWAGSGEPRFAAKTKDIAPDLEVAIWRSRVAPAMMRQIEAHRPRILEIEDGFIRSSGLGADCVPPLSIVVDRAGIYFDPSGPSDLERLLQSGDFPPDLLERARQLREIIVARGVTKYASGDASVARRSGDRRQLLVTGQVEDDRAVLSGLGPTTNLELLRRVREDAADAYIIYKPHPDVEAGHRKGRIDDAACLRFADEIVRDAPITALIAAVDEVHVNTSLAGFEALLREKPVVTYGVPFYAGWGLTMDKGPVPDRRSAKRVLDELVAATLLVYPRYLDPLTGLPCPPEVLVCRLSQTAPESPGLLVRLRRLQGALRRRLPKGRV